MSKTVCKWFEWIGGAWCENCGRAPEDHEGIRWMNKYSDPFDKSHDLLVPWDEYGPGKRLNVPLFTHVFGTITPRVEQYTKPLVWEGDYA